MRQWIDLFESEDEPFIDAHRSGDTIVIDMINVPKAQRGKGVGTAYYEEWEAKLPADIKVVRAWACDAGAGLSTPFWEKLGFDYQYDTKHDLDDFSDNDIDWTTWMWKGVNGHPTPETIWLSPEDFDA